MRILLVDDHSLFRGGLAMMLQHRYGNDVLITECGSFGEALDAVSMTPQPDVVLCDIDMPDLGPDRHIGSVVATAGHVPVVVVTASTFPSVDASSYALGAAGFVSKSQAMDDIIAAIDNVVAGKTYFPKTTGDEASRSNALSQRGARHGLTPKESAVLMGLVQGQSNKQIAREHGVSENAIKIHVRNIFAKLNVNNRTQAAIRASQIFFGSQQDNDKSPGPV